MAAASVDQNALYQVQSPSPDATSPRLIHQQHHAGSNPYAYDSMLKQEPPHPHSMPHYSSSQPHGPTMIDYVPRKLSIDTSLTRHGYEAAAGPQYFHLPAMASPTRRRRGDHMGPFPVNVSHFFKPTKQIYNIYSIDRSRLYTLRINPKVDRGFFLADNDWTCYRRNYFQVSSAFSATDAHGLEAELPCLMEMDNNLCTVTGFAIGISARVANGEKKIELVQHTPKRDKGPQLIPQPKPVRSGGDPHRYNGIGTNQLVATFERLQFKTATANNGKRRAAQQYYILILELYAQIENGQQYKVAMTESAPLVVRGRSPGHYADGNLEALRVFPGMDMAFGRRADFYGAMASPLSPYGVTSPLYSPVTPAMSPASPALPMPMPSSAAHYHGHHQLHAMHSMSAPAGPSPIELQASHHSQYNLPHARSNSIDPTLQNHQAMWNRARAHSLAESDCSTYTTGTSLTNESYNSIDFEELNQSAMGTQAQLTPATLSPVTSPHTSPTSSASSHSSNNTQSSNTAPIHELLQRSPKQYQPTPQYNGMPNWVDDRSVPVTPTTELSKMMGGFGFKREGLEPEAGVVGLYTGLHEQ